MRERETEREREREREREDEWGKGRKRHTQNLKQAPGSELSAQSLTRGLNSRIVRSAASRTEPPRDPIPVFISTLVQGGVE